MQIRKEEEIYQENILFNVQVHCSHLHCRQSFLYHHSFLMSNRGSWCNMPSPEGSKYPPQLPITLPQRPGQYQFRRKCHCPPPVPTIQGLHYSKRGVSGITSLVPLWKIPPPHVPPSVSPTSIDLVATRNKAFFIILCPFFFGLSYPS